jgi:branched-chain amino acid transport system permease protein
MTRLGLLRAAVFFAALLAAPALHLDHWVLSMMIFVLMFAAMASAWNLVGGFAGYPSLGHAAFFGIGAYAVAIPFQGRVLTTGYEVFVVLPLIGVGAALIGVPIGWVAMRTRADVFAIVTITFLFVVQTLAFNLRDFTGGSQGLNLPVPPFPSATYERPFYDVCVALLALAMGLTFLTMRSKVGLSLLTIRADEDKARGIGIPVTGVKVAVFAVSVGVVAMVGAVWAYYEGNIYPQFAVDPLVTIAVVLMTFLGGRATLWGPVLGAFILEGGQQWLAYELGGARIYLIAYAVIFLAVIRWLPQGIVATVNDDSRRRRRRSHLAALPDPATPSSTPAEPAPAARGGPV